MHRFPAPWDRALVASTALVMILLAGVLLWLPGIGLLWALPEGAPTLLRLVPLSMVLIPAITFVLSPRGYAIEGGDLLLERPIGPIRLPLSRITAAGPLPGAPLAGALRYAGTSGLFGHFGRFWSPALGKFRLHATRRRDLVLVDTEEGRWVLSPEPAAAFLAALRRAAPRAGEPVLSGGAAGSGRRKGAVVAVALGLSALLVGGLFAWIAGSAPLGARVEGGAVVVERRWLGDVAIPLTGVRRAGLLPPDARRGWRRTAGTSLPGGAAWGRFSSPALGSFRLYAWRAGPMVLLETDEGKVVLTPEAPEAFLADVAAAGVP